MLTFVNDYTACERSKTVDKNEQVASQYQVNWKQKTQMQMQILLRLHVFSIDTKTHI